MKKSVAIINDELGTMALGFSKAGYDIRAIYIDFSEKNNSNVCRENWGDIVRDVNSETFFYQDMQLLSGIECIAGRIYFSGFTVAGRRQNNVNENQSISQIQYIINESRPKCFILQCSRISEMKFLYEKFFQNIVELGYFIKEEKIDTRFITGFPVNEKVNIIMGALNPNDMKLEFLKNVDIPNFTIEEFCEKQIISERWYYKINPQYLNNVERKNSNCVLSWDRDHYSEEKLMRWNPRMVPLIAQGDSIRKITHREIARFKGIPDEYLLPITNKYVLYQKLMYCSNVQLIQQIASTISFDIDEKPYYIRETTKVFQFEKIILSYFQKKGVNNTLETKNINTDIDFQYKTETVVYGFAFKIYRNNLDISNKVINVSKNLFERNSSKDTTYVLIIGNIVGDEIKKHIVKNYNIFIWDIENLLWILKEFPQLKSDFISLLSFNISDIVPNKPVPDIFEIDLKSIDKVDLQEKLRKIQSGKDEASKYEELCAEIMKFLFSENLEFYETQKKANDGLYRFDYCGKIKHGNSCEFFDTIQNFFKTKYVVFEFKNYSKEITQKEIYATEKYLYEKALRKVALIISRKGIDRNAKKAARGSLREFGKLIICLSDEDVNKLIDMKNNKEDPADYLEALLDDMLMDLEK